MVANTTILVFLGKGQDDHLTLNEPDIAYQIYTTGQQNGAALTTLYDFNTTIGAEEHCSLGAETQLWAVGFEWLSEICGDYTYRNTALVE